MDRLTNVTDKVIKSFEECTKYFTSGSFANLLVNKDLLDRIKEKKDDFIKVLGNAYENDLENQGFEHPLIFRNPKMERTSYFYILSLGILCMLVKTSMLLDTQIN